MENTLFNANAAVNSDQGASFLGKATPTPSRGQEMAVATLQVLFTDYSLQDIIDFHRTYQEKLREKVTSLIA